MVDQTTQATNESQTANAAIEAAVVPIEAAAKISRAAANAIKTPRSKPVRKAAASKREKTAKASTPRSRKETKPAEPVKARKATVRRKVRATTGAETMINQTTTAFPTAPFAADTFKNVFGDVNERAKVAAERSARIVEEMTDLTRGNVEAVVASSKVAAKAVETLSQEAADYSRKSFEEASATLRSFVEAKSTTDLFKLQGDFARSAFDNAVAESARLSETMLKLAGEVAQPLTNRYTVAAERVKSLAA